MITIRIPPLVIDQRRFCKLAHRQINLFLRKQDCRAQAELVIFEAARSTLLAMQGDEKLPSLKALQAEQQRLLEEQQRIYDERAKLKKETRMIDTLKANVDDFLKPAIIQEHENIKNNQRE